MTRLVLIHYYDDIGAADYGWNERSGTKCRKVQTPFRSRGQRERRHRPTRAHEPR
jgi:hypothetical protein